MFGIRALEMPDLDAVVGFAQTEQEQFFFAPTVERPLTAEALGNLVEKRHENTVVLDNGDVAGFANFYKFDKGKSCFIGNVIVSPEKRGQGIACYLLRHMLATAFDTFAMQRVHISCFSENTGALLLYHKLGFNPYALEPREDWNYRAVALVHLDIAKVDINE